MDVKQNALAAYYVSCGDYVVFIKEDGTAQVSYKGLQIIRELTVYNKDTGEQICFDTYPAPDIAYSHPALSAYNRYNSAVELSYAEEGLPNIRLQCKVNNTEVYFCAESDMPLVWKGTVHWGDDMVGETFAVNLDEDTSILRAAVGPAADNFSHALLNRQNGQLLDFGRQLPVRLTYSYDCSCYTIGSRDAEMELFVTEDYYQRKYGVNYRPVRKNSPFQGAPAGFCTYYAWRFRYDEKDLMEAVEAQREKLLPFGANCVLLDLEWVREDLRSNQNSPWDHFHPDTVRFPSGMKAVADGIKAAGFVPQLWYGVTNETHITPEMEAHPEILLTDGSVYCWPGNYFLDVTHPYVREVYLPRFFAQLKQWGYEALKWDLLVETQMSMERHHHLLHDPSRSTTQILRSILELMRKEMGEDVFVCQCAALCRQEIQMGADIFNSMRIGTDVWTWEHFRDNLYYKLCSHYPLHNVMLYCDPDNLILNEDRLQKEYNLPDVISREEAFSRVVPVTLLGQSFMIGEDLRTLPEDLLDLLRRGLPVADVHPAKLGFTRKDPVMTIVIQVQKPFGKWTVFSSVNTTGETVEKTISLRDELGLDEGTYLVYDYRNEKLLGQSAADFSVRLEPRQTALYAIHKKLSVPQVVSSSRHMLQGAVELEQVDWNGQDHTLTVQCKPVRDYPYRITLFVPEGYIPEDSELICVETREELGGSVYALTVPGCEEPQYTAVLQFHK